MAAQALEIADPPYSPATIPPGVYCPNSGDGLRWADFGPLATHTILSEAMITMGVNPHQLARQLGLKNATNVYSWLNGTWTPSRGFFIRLVKLLIQLNTGLKLAEVAWMDWTTGEIHWKRGMGPTTKDPTLTDDFTADDPPPIKPGTYRNREVSKP